MRDQMLRALIQSYYDYWNGLNGIYAAWARAQGIAVHTLFILDVLMEEEGQCTLARICERLALPKQTVHSVLEGLAEDGYLSRRPSQTDRRSKLLALTPAGKAYAAPYLAAMYEWETRAFSRLSADERAAMTTLNARFLHSLRAEVDA